MIFSAMNAPCLDRHEELAEYLTRDPERPDVPTLEQYEAWTDAEREDFDGRRLDYLGGGLTVATPQVQTLVKTVRMAILGNRGRGTGRTGVMVSGQSTVGKTTACIALLRSIRHLYDRQYPGACAHGAIPVAYVEVPAGSSAKAMIGRFAHFYGLPLPARFTLEEILHSVVVAMRDCSTQLVVVDELHNLNRVSPGNGESVDVLKSLSNLVPATFVYSGIDIHRGALLAGQRGNQVSRRFTLLELRRYGHGTAEERRIWNGIVMAFSADLPLLAHKKEQLLKEGPWLHQRSGGNIGTLQRVLVGGALLLIMEGRPENEHLSRDFMDGVPIDMAAEGGGNTLSPPSQRSSGAELR
jgi:hypothetical protein